jgi:hypothetical protein
MCSPSVQDKARTAPRFTGVVQHPRLTGKCKVKRTQSDTVQVYVVVADGAYGTNARFRLFPTIVDLLAMKLL